MNRTELLDRVTDDIVTIAAIGGIVYLGSIGVVNIEVLSAIAGLGGYRLYRNSKKEE